MLVRAALFATASLAAIGIEATILPREDVVDFLAAEGFAKLVKYEAHGKYKSGICTSRNAVKRKEWGSLSKAERRGYINAVLCLQSKPSITPSDVAPGAKSRYDDFIVTHIQQALNIHVTGNFLGWHRYFVWTYEKALRDECGYKGYQPYWNWGKYAEDPVNSPLFDGSDTSLSGDGSFYNTTGVSVQGAPPPFDLILPGNGGGCVTSGPFKDMSVNLGPLAATIGDVPANPHANGLGYNPRCLRRDISENSAVSTRTNATYSLITQHDDIYWFQTYMQGIFSEGILGVHGGGHFTIGGDPGGDFFNSPGDPAFWLHHGQIDRVWWIWQMQDIRTRQHAMVGSTFMFPRDPPAKNQTLDDLQDLGINAGPVKLGDLLDTLNGLFCYIYV